MRVGVSVIFLGSFFLLLHVRLIEKNDEKSQVAAIHKRCPENVLEFDGARDSVVNSYTRIDHRPRSETHLSYLQRRYCDVNMSGHSVEALGTNCVVEVHHHVNEVVHCDENSTLAVRRAVRPPAEAEDGDVVIPVQEDEWLLSQHNEKSVDELGQFRQNEDVHPETFLTVQSVE